MMRLIFHLAVGAVLSVTCTLHARGQQPGQPQGSGPTTSALNNSSGITRIAIIYTDAFYEPGKGINRLVNAVKGVEQEFQARKTELQNMQQRIEQLTGEINNPAARNDPSALRAKSDQLDQLKRDFQRKGEDAQAAYTKRVQEVLNPIFEDLDKAINSFAQQRGALMVLDGSKLEEALLYAGEGLNLTRDFITDYNRRNPPAAGAPSR